MPVLARNPTEPIVRISHRNHTATANQRSNKLDFMKEHCNFFKRKKIGNTTYKERKNCCCSPTRPCVFGSILGTLLMGAVIGPTIVGVLSQQKSTMTTTVATITATTTTDTTTTVTAAATITSTSSLTLSTTSTSTTSATRTSTTTTTTTNLACGSTCVNSTVPTLSRLAFYSFDNVTTDATDNYSLSSIGSPIYVSGWIGTAISFNYFNLQLLSTWHIPLNLRSFTIDFWFYGTDLNTSWDFAFAGQNESQTLSKCLFLNIRNRKLFFGFYLDDLSGSTLILTNQWYHTAFVYDNATQQQYIYLNGLLDGNSGASSLLTTTGNFTAGGARVGGNTNVSVYYSGYIDHSTISARAKSACEIYLTSVLACYFAFDSISPMSDSGPNFVIAINKNATLITGRINQAIEFTSNLSYVAIDRIEAIGSSNTFFTISMWVNPTAVFGGATILHASTNSNGQGTCLAMWGLTSSGMIILNVLDSSNNTISVNSSIALPLNTWTHIAQTFSTTNGNHLYINGTSVASISAPTGQPVGPYTILGASPANTSYCKAGSIVMEQFYGSIDEYRVFRRELNATDICRLANP